MVPMTPKQLLKKWEEFKEKSRKEQAKVVAHQVAKMWGLFFYTAARELYDFAIEMRRARWARKYSEFLTMGAIGVGLFFLSKFLFAGGSGAMAAVAGWFGGFLPASGFMFVSTTIFAPLTLLFSNPVFVSIAVLVLSFIIANKIRKKFLAGGKEGVALNQAYDLQAEMQREDAGHMATIEHQAQYEIDLARQQGQMMENDDATAIEAGVRAIAGLEARKKILEKHVVHLRHPLPPMLDPEPTPDEQVNEEQPRSENSPTIH